MPHKFPSGKTVATGLGNIAERAELAALIGQASNDWNYIEKRMEHLYAGLMARMYLPIGPNFIASHPVAYQIFEELESFRAKQNLFEALLKWAWQQCPSAFQAYENMTRKPLKNAYLARNRVVHTSWGICGDYPEALISVPTFGDKLVYKKSDFLNELVIISNGLSAFSQATMQVFQFSQGNATSPHYS